MSTSPLDAASRLGFWGAAATFAFSLAYAIPQLVLGIDMPATPGWLWLILLPSLLLAPAFLIQMIAIHHRTPPAQQAWTHIGSAFAVAYMVFVSIVYFVNLTVVVPRMAQGGLQEYEVLRYVPRSFMTGIDALGYAAMSLATLFAAPVFSGDPLRLWIRRLFVLNGVLAPIILSTQVYPSMAYAGAPWLLAVPGSSLLLTFFFRQAEMTDGTLPGAA